MKTLLRLVLNAKLIVLIALTSFFFLTPAQGFAQTVYETTSSLTIPGNSTPYSMNFNTGTIPGTATVTLELRVTSAVSPDNRDFIMCGGSSYPFTTGSFTGLPKTVSANISSCVRNYDLSSGNRICTTNAWNYGSCAGLFYGTSITNTVLEYARLTVTLAGSPSVTTQSVSNIGTNTATANGNVTGLGSSNPTQYGHVWNTSANPTVSNNKTELGGKSTTGTYTSSLTGLSPNTTYYVRAYVTNSVATVYGDQVSFTTTNTHDLTYSAGANGSVTGTLSQTVLGGADGSTVTAVPDDGYYFVRWSDGETDNPRTDTSVSDDISVSAIFSSDPALSSISVSASDTGATLTWTSNIEGSSQVVYGLRSALGFETTKLFATTTSHSVALSNLSSCTRYFYQVATSDQYGETATSTRAVFKTTGCEISSLQDTGEESAIDILAGGTIELTNNRSLARLTIPDNYATTSATFQINRLGTTGVTAPGGKDLIDENIFKLVAVDENEEEVTSFHEDLTFIVVYDADIASQYDEDTLDVYHYDSGTWTPLGCTLDTGARTLTCTMSHFSVYGVFGEEIQVEERGIVNTGTIYGCKDTQASNYNYFSAHKQELCTYSNREDDIQKLIEQLRSLLVEAREAGVVLSESMLQMLSTATASAATTTTTEISVRDLKYGMEGDDVRKLQSLLIEQGFSIPAGVTGHFGLQTEYALDAYQVAYNIAPRGGYFGPITRAQMEAVGLAGLWW